ncbi:MAG: glycosyltransferase family 39 protein [Candidatus Nomurabacteria bacterium]|jgi:uncharacterized membrane protein|nr:glycosyltransferase family 39 protein [Candidatus Nomurabacteria bacterium]
MQKLFEKHKRLICILIPVVIGIIYITICATNLQQSVWFDESYSAYLTRFDFSDIWHFAAVDVHPPLYYFLLKIWSVIFGYTDFAMRFMSVFFGAVAIVFAWAWLKRKFGIKPAILATLFMALSPMLIRYGQEMRMYTLATAIIFAATFVFQLAIDTKKRHWWIIYGVLISIGMWTHYFVALVWIAHLAYLIYKYRKKIFQKNIVLSYVTAIVLYLPWLPFFIAQSLDVQGGFWIPEATTVTITDYFTNSFLYLNSADVKGWLLILILAIAIILITIIIRAKQKLTLLSLIAFLPPVLLIILSVPPFKPMFVDRYVIYSSISMSLIAGIAIMLPGTKPQNPKRTIQRFAPACIAVLFITTSIIGITNVLADEKSNAKGIFESVATISEEGIPIISETEWVYYDISFYGTPQNPVYLIDKPQNYQWGSHEPLKTKDYGKIYDLDAFLEDHDKIWLVGNQPEEGILPFMRENWQPINDITQLNYQAIEYQKTK